MTIMTTPATAIGSARTARPRNITAAAMDMSSGRNDGAGRWTPSGGSATTAGSIGGGSRAS